MAKQNFRDLQSQYASIRKDLQTGKYARTYLLMGEEGYYTDKVAAYIADHALGPEEREFNQTVVYGKDADGGTVAALARQYPLMAPRQVVIVREAQNLKGLDGLASYAATPSDTTVLVLCFKGKSMDKRTALYKQLASAGTVLESTPPRDYEIEGWIRELFKEKGCEIEPKAIAMVAEHLGAELQKIENEADKLLTRLPEGTRQITAEHIEQNIGISKEFNVFELTRALSDRDIARALRIGANLAANPKDHPLTVIVSTLFTHFQRIAALGIKQWELKKAARPPMSESDVAALLKLPFATFAREYLTAAANYPTPKAFAIIGLLREWDMKSKGLGNDSTDDAELLRELILRIATV